MNANDVLGGLVEKATKGKWVWFNGCSWWRIGTVTERGEGDRYVLAPTKDHDGHPNLSVREEDRDLIVAAVNALPLLLEVVAKARDLSNAAGIGVCGCSIVKAKQMDAALEGMRSALARLDEGVRP